MKIKSIKIHNYGPIKDLALSPGNFELVFGLNESGKTAIVEVLSYILFRSFKNRYGKPADVNIAIEISGRVHNLPAKKSGTALPAGEIANLMYVQASKTSVYGSGEEARFWDRIKIMLSQAGQNVSFAKLGKKIIEGVGLTPQKKEWKTEKQTVIDADKQRKNELDSYVKEIGEIENKKIELAKLLETQTRIKKEFEAIKKFKKYKTYRDLKEWYDNYVDLKNRLTEYVRYEKKYLEDWQKLEAEKNSRATLDKRFKGDKEMITTLEKELDELRKKAKFFETWGFKEYLGKAEAPAKEPGMFYSTLIFLIGFIVLILSFRLRFTILAPLAIFAAGIILFVILQFKKARIRKVHLESELWLAKARVIFPEVKNVGEFSEKITEIRQDIIKKETLINEKTELSKTVSFDKTVKEIEQAINELRDKTGLAEMVQLKEKIDKKEDISRKLNEFAGRITGLLSEKDDTKWPRLISERKIEAPEGEIDAFREAELENRLVKTAQKTDDLKSEIKIFEEVKQKKFNIADVRQAFIELARLKNKLKNYELEKQAALKTYEILSEMSGELDNFIQDIIEGEASLSNYFQSVTGRYEAVKVQNKNFVVVDKNNREFRNEDLSSGAQDQLYLCFRLAALRRIYPEGTFLILDDAFIFADWNRRKKLVELLKKFIIEGNQVIYLTSDDHTRDIFKEAGAKITTLKP